ncbi:dihydroorotate dehydrogenase (quinone) [Aphanothece hegewaldii CCALA 016]|uniref:Dihydroorotate dehydrogenase (quinone) n=1 Tax=Aphanothece hegewaldii CCALA 016 TaxID=2107694 RepID=A0A2T1M347_9CHRO|nr:quinone-dependent dihydroorotate dehydrogenase [Aphanothece hegewaldii]PSF39259.1 dihydroorotate dehydrogenase (quinone) [Aphanothece hegewaldii CCALA 016]
MFELLKPAYPLAFSAVRGTLEETHLQLLKTLNWIDRTRAQPLGNWLLSELEQSFCYNDPRLSQSFWGLNFSNPLGLAAGFDKDGLGAGIWSNFGFGFAELGAITLHSQSGNPPPRLFRLPQDKAALNRMGANNNGAAVMAKTLQETWDRKPRSIPIGINLCKSKITDLEDAPQDYVGSFQYLKDWADYFVINVSSPNTPGLRSLQSGEQLEPILAALTDANQNNQPILIKIAPDLDWDAISDIIKLAQNYRLSGIIATNTTTRRDILQTKILKETGKPLSSEAGGISGLPLRDRSTEVIRFIYQETFGTLPIIGVGGIFTVDDAWEKITAGASLLQTYTGWLYQGPWMIPSILKGLIAKLDQSGLSNISSSVGIKS